jgi:hypothetical protein
MTYVAAFNCTFFSISYSGSSSSTIGIGLWTAESAESPWYAGDDYYYSSNLCYGYNQYASFTTDDLDGAMKAARAFGMMTSIVGLICFLLILILSCVSFGDHDQYTMIVAGMSVFLGIFTMLDLVSENASTTLYFTLWLLSI